MQIYNRKELAENLYEVLESDGTVLKNHNGKPYPHLSENISRNLTEDLNEIASKYYKVSDSEEEVEEALFNNVLARVSGEEKRQSFGYCLLSSLIEYQDARLDVEIDVEMQIQWDRLFRMNSIPNGGELELNANQKASGFFENNWQNFDLNYCQSFEEMEENEVKFVSEELVKKLQEIYPDIPNYPSTNGTKKLAAGWLIEKAGWKGKTIGNIGVHKNQALVLVNYGGGTGEEILALSTAIIEDIKSKFKVELEREVNIM